jgi:diguanylate cyclase (GGDEF)-like protein
MKSFVLRLAYKLPGLEFDYRQHYLKQDIDQIVTGIFLWVLPYLSFAYSDYLLFGLDQIFYRLFALRVMYLLFCLLIVYFIKKSVRHPSEFDRLVFLWSISTFIWNVAINLTQPQNLLSGIIISLVGIFIFYVFIPNPFYLRVLTPMVYSIFIFLVIVFTKREIAPPFVEALVVALLITNLIGILSSVRLHVSRRQEFLANREEEKVRAELHRLASTDPLTGVYNRRRLLELAGETLYRFKRYGRPFSIMVMDLDGFKNVNDTLGHQQGDYVLMEFAEMVNREKREGDALGRMGGDEFCLILPETKPQSASALAIRIIQKCQEISPGRGALEVNVTVSIGISEICPEDQTLDNLFSRADAALYHAKHNGRNCWKTI